MDAVDAQSRGSFFLLRPIIFLSPLTLIALGLTWQAHAHIDRGFSPQIHLRLLSHLVLSFIIGVFETDLRGKIPANNKHQSASRSFREYVSITVATNIFYGTHLNILQAELLSQPPPPKNTSAFEKKTSPSIRSSSSN